MRCGSSIARWSGPSCSPGKSLRLALVSARFEGVLQGGLRAAVDEIRARVSEAFSAAGRPIDWLKVISLDLLKLLEGKLVSDHLPPSGSWRAMR